MKKVPIIFIFFIIFSAFTLLGQEFGSKVREEPSGIEDLLKRAKPEAAFETIPLEEAIDPEEYILGPGDVLSIDLWGLAPVSFTPQITPEATVLIPTVGVVDIKNLTLAQAKKVIQEKIKSKYTEGDISITLLSPRQFRVTVVGAVNRPGAVLATAIDRVSDAIEKAGGFVEELKVTKAIEQISIESADRELTQTRTSSIDRRAALQSKEASQRNIAVTRANGQVIKADVLKALVTGDKDCNPQLMDGDVIYVPIREYIVGMVGIYGAVKMEGEYEFKQGDRISDLIALALGLAIDADSSNAELVRFAHELAKIEQIPINLREVYSSNSNPDKDLRLEPDDRLYIRAIPDFHAKKQVNVLGEVMFPGDYAIIEGRTRLSDIISAAGGFTDEASLIGAELIRRAREDVIDLEYERLRKMLVADMTRDEREYFKIKSRQKQGAVAINFYDLLVKGVKTEDILLLDRDWIHIPPKGRTVNVSGQVLYPGLVVFEEGKGLDYYINAAGGYIWNARRGKVRIIKAKTGEWLRPKKGEVIEIGDTIFVPEKPETDWWALFKDFMRIAAEAATVWLVIERATSN